MANQEPGNKKDRSGGDVTKAELVKTPVVPKTHWDILSATGPSDGNTK